VTSSLLLGARTIGAVAAHLSYVSQRGALEFETDEGQRDPKEGCVLTAPPMLISGLEWQIRLRAVRVLLPILAWFQAAPFGQML
jgi:hypothetical protein